MITPPPFGKRLPGATYTARDCIERRGPPWSTLIVAACNRAALSPTDVQVVKWHHATSRLSLLMYPGFLLEPHPSLLASVTVDMSSGEVRRTDFSPDGDPPILHRCEEFLDEGHPATARLRALTRLEERYGLYADTARIGRRSFWHAQIARRGLCSGDGWDLQPPADAGIPAGLPLPAWPSERQRTAIRRPSLSVPPRLLIERGLLSSGDTYFDYGCGHGLDLPLLELLGVLTHGWDPAHRPGVAKKMAAVVHCGYVLNVVESIEQRHAIVRDAWQHAERLLSVAVRVRDAEAAPLGTPHGDGELTRSGTFQHYFESDELITMLEEVLGHPVLALAPGIAVVAREAATLHEVIARRVRVALPTRMSPESSTGDESTTQDPAAQWSTAQRSPAQRSIDGQSNAQSPKVRWLGPRQRKIVALLDEVGPLLQDLGRAPRPAEWTPPALAVELGLSPAQVWRAYALSIGPVAVAALAERRRTDAVVFLALAHFRRVPTLAELPLRTRIDIEDLFGGHRAAVLAAKACLVQIGDPAVIARLCDEAGLGVCDGQALYVHVSLLPRLHPVLRCYVGCAEMLGAPVADGDVVKLHKRSRKVTVQVYQNFAEHPLPALIERIKVDLRARKVTLHSHRSEPRQLLYDKDQYLTEDDPRRPAWQAQGEHLATLIGPVTGLGPHHLDLRQRILTAGGTPNDWAPEHYPAPEADDFDEEEVTIQEVSPT